MPRLNGNYQFKFASSGENDDSPSTENSKRYDIHPIELVVQSVLGEPLEDLSNQLQVLHESQVILIARLAIIEEKLKKYRSQVNVDLNIKETEERLNGLRKKLTNLLQRLTIVEERVQRKITQTTD